MTRKHGANAPKDAEPTAQLGRDSFLARLKQLKDERQRLLDNANAFNGAIQECEHWLSVLDQAAEE